MESPCLKRNLYKFVLVLLVACVVLYFSIAPNSSPRNMVFPQPNAQKKALFGNCGAPDLSRQEDLTCSGLSSTEKGSEPTQDPLCKPLPPNLSLNATLVPCDWDKRQVKCQTRVRAVPRCSLTASPKLRYETVPVGTPPASVKFGDKCLSDIIKCACFDEGFPVPRIAHCVNFGKREFTFFAFVSLISVVKVYNPCVILMHADALPYGPYWDQLMQMVPQLIHIVVERPTEIFGNPIHVVQHQADIARLRAEMHYGGLYLDMDVWLLHSLDKFRQYHGVTLGQEGPDSICNGLYLSVPNATFLHRWYDSYHTFNDKQWGEHSAYGGFRLAHKFPAEAQLAHTFFLPELQKIECQCYMGKFNWTANHAMHLWHKAIRFPNRPNLERKGTSLGDILRHILFGSTDNCVKNRCNLPLARDNTSY